MFDGLAHGLPFISSDIGFFREFSSRGLGMSVGRKADNFSAAFKQIEKYYNSYKNNVDRFKRNLLWSNIARAHRELYAKIIRSKPENFIIGY
jgi:glycosyltransferase involved in cell wall biosynthesis